MRIRLDTDSIRYIALFERNTGAHVKDCIEYDDKLIFIVESGHASIAIGRGGTNGRGLQRAVGKVVEVIEFSDDPAQFVTNIFRPLRLDNVYVSEKSDGQRVMNICTSKNAVLAKMKIKKAKMLLPRYFGIECVNFI
jgi:N utilization substance protein A